MIDKLGSSPDPALESILSNIHENAVGTQYATSTPTSVPSGKVVVADDGAGTVSVSVKTAEGNIVTLTPAVAPTPQVGFGDWAAKVNNTVYQAATDGFVVGTSGYSNSFYTDGSNPPTTVRMETSGDAGVVIKIPFCFPVKKGDYWKVTGASLVFWIPLGV